MWYLEPVLKGSAQSCLGQLGDFRCRFRREFFSGCPAQWGDSEYACVSRGWVASPPGNVWCSPSSSWNFELKGHAGTFSLVVSFLSESSPVGGFFSMQKSGNPNFAGHRELSLASWPLSQNQSSMFNKKRPKCLNNHPGKQPSVYPFPGGSVFQNSCILHYNSVTEVNMERTCHWHHPTRGFQN